MNNLSAVSETALLTLKARVLETEKKSPIIHDEKGREILNKIETLASADISKRVLDRKLASTLTDYLVLRARKYDSFTKSFLKENPDGLVVSLGCGFDTRYWRIDSKSWNYIEIDLPEVIEMKRNSGSEAGASFNSGIKDAKEIENYANNLKVLEEWSYFEDPDIRPRFQRVFRHFKSMSRTQWTIRASIT